MQVLGIDSSTRRGGVALANEQGIVATFTLSNKLSYSQRLLSMIDLILERVPLSMEELDGFAIACGPGSFTGLRIGMSMAKGLALATGKPAIGIPTLDALASHLCFSPYLVCPLLDARKGEIYTAFYRAERGEMHKLTDDLVISPEEFCMMIREPVILLGDGLAAYEEMLREKLQHLAILNPFVTSLSGVANVALLGVQKFLKGEFPTTSSLKPIYVRRPEAEVTWLRGS